MARPPSSHLPLLFPFQILSTRIVNQPALLRIWLREVMIYWTRWGAVILIIVLLLFFPTRSRPLGVAILLTMSAGNLALGWLLLRKQRPLRVERIRLLATSFDWLLATGTLFVFSVHLAEIAPAGALTVQMMSSIRYRLRGVLFALAGATALVCLWLGMHIFLFNALDSDRVPALAVGWIAALAMIALLQGDCHLGRRGTTRLRASTT